MQVLTNKHQFINYYFKHLRNVHNIINFALSPSLNDLFCMNNKSKFYPFHSPVGESVALKSGQGHIPCENVTVKFNGGYDLATVQRSHRNFLSEIANI